MLKILPIAANSLPIAAIHLTMLGLALTMGCAAPATADKEPIQREIVTISAEQAPEVVAKQSALKEERKDGVLQNTGQCRPILLTDPVFDNANALKAWQAYQNNQFGEAASQFSSLTQDTSLSKSDLQKVYFLAALAAQKNGDPAAAADWMKKAHEFSAPLKRASAVYGTKFGYEAKKWSDIVDFTETLLASDDYRTYRGIALTNLGKYEAAISEFERIEKYPKNIRLDALDAKARAQSETSQLKSALETYRRIYELDPNSPQGQVAQDAILAQKDKWPKGFVFPRPTQKADASKSAREIAEGHFNAHRSEKAIAAYTKLLKDDKARKDIPNICDDLYGIARSHVKLRSHSKSLPFFKEALETCKDTDLHVKILYSAGKAAWNAGENAQAIAWYQQIIDQYPKHSYADDAYHYQAQILTGQNKPDEAREKLNAQIKTYPDGDMAKDAYWMLLSDLLDRGENAQAVAFVDENIEHAGESDLYSQGRLRYFQGRAYEKLNNKEAAVQNYLKILDEYPLSYYAMLALGRLEAIDNAQAKTWIETYRTTTYRPEQALDYCFQVIPGETSFVAAQSLTQLGLYEDALDEINPLLASSDERVTYEARLARAILLQKNNQISDSARLAAGLLNPQSDLIYHSYAPWLLAYPKPWSQIVTGAAQPESTLYYTTYAIMREESYYNPKAESWANARGLMQLMLPTAQSSAVDAGLPKPSAADLFKPEISIPIGASYIDKLNRILVPHPMFVLPGYNAGQGNVGKWMTRFADIEVDMYVEKIPFKEARHYAKRVGTTLWRYRWLYDENMPKLFDPAQKVGELK
ncbi:MAG: transglycosylase SLT domain-containing protein [Proteobacteria bacterium]|nr:transglycosylase SLT domain-containing protein [Pseudomonadota bacterium]